MMSRIVRVALVVIAVVFGLALIFGELSVSGSLPPMTSAAAGDQSIDVIISGTKQSDEQGSCSVGSKEGAPYGLAMPHQLIVENADGTIIAKRDLRDFNPDDITAETGSTSCIVNVSVAVPESSYYTVRADDVFVSVIDANDLPLDTSPDKITHKLPWIDFSD